jgi:ArsR family transcriptional regulator
MPSERDTHAATDLFKVLGDPTRMKLLSLLRSAPLCVHDLSAILGMHQTAVSHQLKVLRLNRLVRYSRDGKMTIYELADSHVAQLLDTGLEHVRESES